MAVQSRESVPPVSWHAAKRWDDRTDPDSVAPETAWRHAQRVRPAGRFRNCDEVRIHWPTRTVLLQRGPAIMTVYAIDGIEPEYRRAIEHALDGRAQ